MKNVLVISTSPRKDSNSDTLARVFARGAEEAGNRTEVVSLRGLDLGFCQGCLACQKSGRCVIKDDAPALVDKMEQADVIAFATPIYYYCVSGQMKTLLDRANPLFPKDYRFRDIYLLASAAEDEESAVDGAVNALEGWIACFPKSRLAGEIRGVGATDPGDIKSHTAVLKEAERMGKNA